LEVRFGSPLDRGAATPPDSSSRSHRFVEIPRAVHTLHEGNPEAVLDALREFLGF
jgi:pimeloyl-ACP methyl ester carboxylesterase